MPLAPKISVTVTDTIGGKLIALQDTTGAYNVSTNPGGYGAPNYATTDLDWALLWFRNYESESYIEQKLTSLVSILGSGQSVAGFTEGKFDDGIWELKYYPVIAHPVTPDVDTNITWTVGSKEFNLADADTILDGAIGILVKDQSEIKIYFLDPDTPATNAVATVTEVLPSAGTGNLAVVFEADTRFMITADADDCLAKDTGRFICECSCFSPEMQQMYLRMGKRDGASLHFNQGNYQAAHNLIIQLKSYCDNTSNCGCK